LDAAETALKIDEQADQQNQAESAAADDGSTKVKSTATEQQQQNHHKENYIQDISVMPASSGCHGVFPPQLLAEATICTGQTTGTLAASHAIQINAKPPRPENAA
jgi:hypothetical protein